MFFNVFFISNKCYESRDKTFYVIWKREKVEIFPINEKHVPVSLFHPEPFAVIAPAILCCNDLKTDGNNVLYKAENIFLDLQFH